MKKTYEQRWREAEADIKIFNSWEEMKISPEEALKQYNKLHPEKELTLKEFNVMAYSYGYNRNRYFMEHN